LADAAEEKFLKASHIIRHYMYVDDVLAGANCLQEARLAIQELQNALSSTGFKLSKWTSNREIIVGDIPNEHLLHVE